ncbi:SH3 domain-containing protein [Sneathiella marina]|uniref:SH3 domain-containing protein n=1 Tax=Sneathiella marina TaxID=2950108 RepID=A0ABY4WCR0_9PROT|nr:SH3 domain-containing protein [Sneathiella marina]USG62426.1 SH3 domain-containing protein [Sneathiella marina]
MKNWFQIGIVSLLVAVSYPVSAGEVIGFVNSTKSSHMVIPNTKLRALIAEFLDPAATGIGQSLGYLVWRETLTAISDQAKAGVILARAPEGKNLTELIGDRYHLAATEIANFQKAAMILWGAVIENPDGELVINTHLTLLPTELASGDLILRFTAGDNSNAGLQTAISRSKFNFATVTRSRKDLFDRRLVSRRVANLRAAPSREAEKITQIPPGTVIQSLDMQGAWFKVVLRDGREAYIENSLVDVPPRQIDVSKTEINVRVGPGTDHQVIATRDVIGTFEVLNMTYREGQGLWYEVDLEGEPVWIYAALTRPRYSLPAVHFLAGLYRYYASRFKDASSEFTQFLTSGVEGRNVNLAAGYQLLGASQVMGKQAYELDENIVNIFSKAVELTPYDPAAYNLRALANIAVNNNLDLAIKDLKVSAELDSMSDTAALLVNDLNNVVNQRTPGNRFLLQKLRPDSDQKLVINNIAKSFSR